MVDSEFDDNSINGEYDPADDETNNVSDLVDGRNDDPCRQSGYSNGKLFENINYRNVKKQNGNKFNICQLDGRRSQTFRNFLQLDGVASSSSSSVSSLSPGASSATSEYESEHEVDNTPEPVVLVPAAVQQAAGQPLVLEVDSTSPPPSRSAWSPTSGVSTTRLITSDGS
jgi:hypothetical protein